MVTLLSTRTEVLQFPREPDHRIGGVKRHDILSLSEGLVVTYFRARGAETELTPSLPILSQSTTGHDPFKQMVMRTAAKKRLSRRQGQGGASTMYICTVHGPEWGKGCRDRTGPFSTCSFAMDCCTNRRTGCAHPVRTLLTKNQPSETDHGPKVLFLLISKFSRET